MGNLRRWLSGPHVPQEARILALGPAAVPELIAVLTDRKLWEIDASGNGWAPIHAARLLAQLRATEAIEPLLSVVQATEAGEDPLFDAAVLALEELGAPALEPVWRAFEAAAGDEELRGELLWILAGLSTADGRVLPHLFEVFARSEEEGAGMLAAHGDKSALPAIFAALDRQHLREPAVDDQRAVVELVAAVRALGGEPREADLARERALNELRLALAELDEDERILSCRRVHEPLPRWHPPTPEPGVHAATHAVVENQLALDDPPETRAALARLIAEGLDRHEATHAIASTFVGLLAVAAKGGATAFDSAAYRRALAVLTPASWRAKLDEE